MQLCRKLAILTGPRDSGKTAVMTELAGMLRAAGTSFGGVITKSGFSDGRKCIYNASCAATGETVRLLELSKNGPVVAEEGFVFASRVLAKTRGARVLLADEFGPLEASGKGFWPALSALDGFDGAVITTRLSLVKTVLETFKYGECMIFEAASTAETARGILAWLSK
jgi:nucleoside-triphosphatase THEP1